jgi:uncharacterized membrane protein HdeD (DUF308 family)
MQTPEGRRRADGGALALGGTIFAAVLLVLIGLWQIFLGIAAIAQGGYFIVDPSYAYEFSVAAWGWIHLLLGVVLALAGLALFTGALWARVVGIVLAVLSALAHFLFLPYYPIGSLVMILVAIFVIWSLVHTPDRA